MTTYWHSVFPDYIATVPASPTHWDGAFPVYSIIAPPRVLSASIQSQAVIRITFDSAMLVDSDLTNPGNYILTGPISLFVTSVSVVAGSSDTQVDLTINDTIYVGGLYTVTVLNVHNFRGDDLDTLHDTATFSAPLYIIWVATTGNDTTGTGSQTEPYLTIERALIDFASGSQIRILDGTYTPSDTILIDGLEGSIFAENPQGVTIQPQSTTYYGAAIAIVNSTRFSIQGVNIIQSAIDGSHVIGIYGNNVTNFIAYTCSVSAFESAYESIYGIFVRGTGRIENCTVSDISCGGNELFGINSLGLHVIDCPVTELSGTGSCSVRGIVTNVIPPPPMPS